MRRFLMGLAVLGLVAGCTSSKDAAQLGAADRGVAATAHSRKPQLLQLRQDAFASLPDRGELLAYDGVRQIKHAGAYTAYPVSLSEAHALRAVAGGELVVKAPNGELVRLKYDRRVEHDDGNWTWIGHNADGADAVLTFGDKAVFGSIPQGMGDTLRLTMFKGQSWLVATDRSKLADAAGLGIRKGGSDALIPPKLSDVSAGGSRSMAASIASIAAALPSAQPVDILLGYTPGFAAALGGESQAVTRLVNLTDISNQAYENSGVSMRVRLVKALLVNYADNTDNGDALEKLTGYKSGAGGGPITPDPAFNALRAARDEFGADLVSLVRKFSTPENSGCGIAWMIGGGQTGIETADAPFGYSVVSDGTDLDETNQKTYFCREETLAHELGHNMGQAHNQEDSSSTGLHAYSYGYREASTTGFYTVMAYALKDASQSPIRYFANPAVAYGGRPTGVANTNDNVRSMNESMPTVASFRAVVVPIKLPPEQDANGDGRDDIFWYNSGLGKQQTWMMNGTTWSYGPENLIDGRYRVAGIGDFNGDGLADILWYDLAKTSLWQWQARAAGGYNVVYMTTYPTGWDVVGIKDGNADGRADLFLHNPITGTLQSWRMNGTAWTVGPANAINVKYSVAALGDFNGDGMADIFWRDQARTELVQWQAQAGGTFLALPKIRKHPAAGWEVVGVRDANADGRADVFWHSATAGGQQTWLMNGDKLTSTPVYPISGLYSVSGIGDFNGDGRADILWHDQAKTTFWQWQAKADGSYNIVFLRAYPNGWRVQR